MIKARHLLISGLVLWGSSVSLASAATFIVNTLTDAVDSDTSDGVCLTAAGECSLRAAVQQANASPGADVIELMDGVYNLRLSGMNEDDGKTGDLDVKSEITINGSSADQVSIDGGRQDRVLQVHSSAKLTLNSLTVRNGSAGQTASGGGIDNDQGQLIINDCNITRNSVFGMGGGISSFRGTLVVNRSTVSENISLNTGGGIMIQDGNATINDSTIRDNGNTAATISTFGGGIYNSSLFGILEINNSTISGHTAFLDGGGVYSLIGTVKITNSTISDNSANRNGGGLYISSGNSTFGSNGNRLLNVTIANNSANGFDSTGASLGKGGGGIYVRGAAPLRFANTIIANNSQGHDCANDGEIISLGHNLDSDGTCELSGDSSSISSGDAGLGSLADNGGPTLTHALLANSDALDAGDDALCPPADQRGYSRPDSGCDIGAYEAEGIEPIIPITAPPANDGTSNDGINSAPTVFDLVLAVDAGGTVSSQAVGADPNGDPLTFELVQPPSKGKLGWEWEGAISPPAGAFTYVANADASGSDTFTFHACDDKGLCSAPATLSIAISDSSISGEISIQVAPSSGGATASPVQVVPGDSLEAKVADVDYTQPLGVFYFSVSNIPVAADSQLNGTEVIIQLPDTAIIDANATVRKLDQLDVWRTLPEVPDPNRLNKTTGKIDHDAKTLTLVLYDNDDFDLDPTVGVILDPVAISVAKAEVIQVTDADSSTSSSDGSSDVSVDNTDTGTTTETTTVTTSGGSGAFHPVILLLFGLMGLRRRSRH